jgi:hypothetical protein
MALTIGLCVSTSAAAGKPADTPENRQATAARYIAVAQFEALIQSIIEAAALKLPENRRSDFIDRMKWNVREENIEAVAMDSLVARFTAAELDALVEFAESPRGRGVMQKFGAYMSDVMQEIQSEMVRAYRIYKEEKSRENR